MAYDMFDQKLNEGDWVCCTRSSSRGSSAMYIGKIENITDKKVKVIDRAGHTHQKDHKRVFVVTEQIKSIPHLMI